MTIGPPDLAWVERQRGEWSGMENRLWGLFYRPNAAPQTVVFLAGVDTISGNIPRVLKCDAIFVRSTGESAGFKIEWPIHELKYYMRGDERRIVRTMKDDPRWEFFERGERFDWEHEDQYERRLKKHRVTRRTIIDYTKHFGVDIEDDSFWRSDYDALYMVCDLPPVHMRPPL